MAKVFAFRIWNKRREYLASPQFDVWPHSSDEADAHHFDSRKQARDTIVEIHGGDRRALDAYKIYRVGSRG